MKKVNKYSLFFTIILFLGVFSEINAESIRITSGSMNAAYLLGAYRGNVGALRGENLNILVFGREISNTQSLPGGCAPGESCQPGSTFELTDGTFGSGVPTIQRHTIPPGILTDPALGLVGMNLVFDQSSITLPNSIRDSFSISVPFSMTGIVELRSPPPNGDLVFSSLIHGSGLATLNFNWNTGGTTPAYELTSYDFVFTSGTPEPVPEPATLLLLGAGLAGIGGHSIRKRKKKNSS